MEENPFIINVRVNKNKFFRAFMNFGCLYYAIISKKHAIRFNLSRIDILPRLMKEFKGKDIVGLTRDFQTVGYVHVGNEVFIRAGAH
jgi:hypothetical protein